MVDDTESHQYKIMLFTYGMKDGFPSNVSTAERLAKLKQYQDAWRAPTTQGPLSPAVSLPLKESARAIRVCGNILSYVTDTALEIVRLPSRIRGIEQKCWAFQFEEVGYPECGVIVLDPQQDLLVMIQQIDPEAE